MSKIFPPAFMLATVDIPPAKSMTNRTNAWFKSEQEIRAQLEAAREQQKLEEQRKFCKQHESWVQFAHAEFLEAFNRDPSKDRHTIQFTKEQIPIVQQCVLPVWRAQGYFGSIVNKHSAEIGFRSAIRWDRHQCETMELAANQPE